MSRFDPVATARGSDTPGSVPVTRFTGLLLLDAYPAIELLGHFRSSAERRCARLFNCPFQVRA